MHEITRTIIGNNAASPQVYRLAFESARAAGLSKTDQIRFAGIVVDLFFISHSAEGTLIFSIGHNNDGQPALRATLENTHLSVETILPILPEKTAINPDQTFSDYELMHQRYMELEQRNRDLQQFTFAISHELKNSLTKLKLSVSLLDADDLPEPANKNFQILRRASGELEKTLLGLNEIIHFRHFSPVAKPVSLSGIFSQVQEELEENIQAAHAMVTTDFGGISGWPYVEIYLKSIFSNLLSNSLKYTYANRRPEIAITAVKQDNDVLLTFTDNGHGIDLERHSRDIFMPFSRFANNKQEGKGLGLYIIKSMVERNGGHIELTSQPGEGTTFRMLLRSY